MFPFIRQRDTMQCGAACLGMICRFYGYKASLPEISGICSPTAQGVSLYGIQQSAEAMGFEAFPCKIALRKMRDAALPCILHWNQNHFVVLYKIKGDSYYIADPGKGLYRCKRDEFINHWASAPGEDPVGVALFLKPAGPLSVPEEEGNAGGRSLRILLRYFSRYRKQIFLVLAGLLLGSVLQLVLPFLTQSVVDVGIKEKNIGFIWLILLGELMIVTGKAATDIFRRRLLLHISMRINISLVSDFFIKLLKLPMSFFDTKLMGDLLQRIGDHIRIQSFLTNQVLGIIFNFLSFIIFGIVLFVYDSLIFCVFLAGSAIYGVWISMFLRRRKVLDYELFEQ